MNDPRIELLGEQALLVRLGDVIDPQLSGRVRALAARIERQRPPWLLDCVPAYASLALFVNSDAQIAEAGAWLSLLLDDDTAQDDENSSRTVEIPVCYESEFSLDLEAIAAACGLDHTQVIERHHQASYCVAMLGFAAGFPYLLGLDPALAMPRLATPRSLVPAGSVAIGGAQTGIYPRDSPGGWNIIGRTPLLLFDAGLDPPALLSPGDKVKFVPISRAEFHASRVLR